MMIVKGRTGIWTRDLFHPKEESYHLDHPALEAEQACSSSYINYRKMLLKIWNAT